jgi:hypothetical protein
MQRPLTGNQERALNIPKLISSTLIVLASCWAPGSFGQIAPDGTDGRFHDDLLDHFVGKWDVSATVHGEKFTLDREAEWVMGHQYLRIHEKSREDIPWLKVPFERTLFIGYNHRYKRYVVYELSVHGSDSEGFSYAVRSGNELKFEYKIDADVIANVFTWEPASGSWNFQVRPVIAGKEQKPFTDQKAVPAKPSSK